MLDDDDIFLEPPRSHRRFILRKRKRRESDVSDVTSVHSLDISEGPEPYTKKKKGLSKVASLASLLTTPMRPVRKMGEALQRSFTGRSPPGDRNGKHTGGAKTALTSTPSSSNLPSPGSFSLPASPSRVSLRRSSSVSSRRSISSLTPYRPPPPTPTRQRPARYWSDIVSKDSKVLGVTEVNRQEAIFELFLGEEDLIEDMQLVKKTYHDSLLQLNILSPEEVQQIFGDLHQLLPLHQDLSNKMLLQRNDQGVTDAIGQTLLDWVPGLRQYVSYCSNQVKAKVLLDEKKSCDKKFEDFLQRCLESPFSRKLDLWNFLDVPRSRLMKYPLLLKQILRLTPSGHVDEKLLKEAISKVEDIIREVDTETGAAKVRFTVERLEYLEERHKDPLIEEATTLYCSGALRNNRGTKLHCFLFDNIFVLTRPTNRDRGMSYQVYRQPIPAGQLVVEDLRDGEVKVGSFRSFHAGQTSKNIFRVEFRDPTLGNGHTLMASDEHNKKQWIQWLRRVVENAQPFSHLEECYGHRRMGQLVKQSSVDEVTSRKVGENRAKGLKRQSEPNISTAAQPGALEQLALSMIAIKKFKEGLHRQNENKKQKTSTSSLTDMTSPRRPGRSQKAEPRTLLDMDQNPRIRTRSWSYLSKVSECEEEDPKLKRKNSTRQLSKSSSDLIKD